MVSLNIQNNESRSDLWWAYSTEFGWVVQDRALFVNRCWDYPEEMKFVRCEDWSEYEQGENAWDYKEASRYLKSLAPREAFIKNHELEELKRDFFSNIQEAA